MISPMYYSLLGKTRVVTAKDLENFKVITFNKSELMELKMMTRPDLLALMKALGIRTYHDLPIIACEDDELRSAYLVFRSGYAKEARKKWANLWSNVAEGAFEFYDDVIKELQRE